MTSIALDVGHAAVVRRGIWHRLVMPEPGRLLFINIRTSRRAEPTAPRWTSPKYVVDNPYAAPAPSP